MNIDASINQCFVHNISSMALTEATKEDIWLKGLAINLDLQQRTMTLLAIAKVQSLLRRTKYFIEAQSISKFTVIKFEIGSTHKKSS